ncbi:hypothetical protein D3C85_1336310 [compost metagenome]
MLHAEPSAQPAEANSSAAAPAGDACRLLPMFSTTMPAMPSSTPASSILRGMCPNRRANRIANSGTVATTSAATPEDTSFCARVTKPLPMAGIRMPSRVAPFSSASVGLAAPRQRRKPYISVPASTKRTPAIRNGGHDVTAMWMAK